jgi:hypothetical protein
MISLIEPVKGLTSVPAIASSHPPSPSLSSEVNEVVVKEGVPTIGDGYADCYTKLFDV